MIILHVYLYLYRKYHYHHSWILCYQYLQCNKKYVLNNTMNWPDPCNLTSYMVFFWLFFLPPFLGLGLPSSSSPSSSYWNQIHMYVEHPSILTSHMMMNSFSNQSRRLLVWCHSWIELKYRLQKVSKKVWKLYGILKNALIPFAKTQIGMKQKCFSDH